MFSKMGGPNECHTDESETCGRYLQRGDHSLYVRDGNGRSHGRRERPMGRKRAPSGPVGWFSCSVCGPSWPSVLSKACRMHRAIRRCYGEATNKSVCRVETGLRLILFWLPSCLATPLRWCARIRISRTTCAPRAACEGHSASDAICAIA